MSPRVRKLMLTVHVASSVGWLGAIAAYIALNVPALASEDEQTVRAAYLMMDVVARYVLVPIAAASLVTGIAQSLGTPWSLFRHYWVTISLALTTFAFVILVPRGLTRYGWRRARNQRANTAHVMDISASQVEA